MLDKIGYFKKLHLSRSNSYNVEPSGVSPDATCGLPSSDKVESNTSFKCLSSADVGEKQEGVGNVKVIIIISYPKYLFAVTTGPCANGVEQPLF